MNVAELRTKPISDQLTFLLSGTARPEVLLGGIVFESYVRRTVFEAPASEVQLLPFQQRVVESEPVGRRKPLKIDMSQEIAEAVEFLKDDADFFTAAVLPRVIAGAVGDLDLTWVAVFRGGMWAIEARHATPRTGFYSVMRRKFEALAEHGIRYVALRGSPGAMKACVISRSKLEPSGHSPRTLPYFRISADRFQPVGYDVWPNLLEMMARA